MKYQRKILSSSFMAILNLEFKFQYIEAKANTLYNRIQIFNHNLNNTQFISLYYIRWKYGYLILHMLIAFCEFVEICIFTC